MWLEIQRSPDDDPGCQGPSVADVPADGPWPEDTPVESHGLTEEGDLVERTITLSPALLIGIFALAVGCIVLAGAGLWLAGDGVGLGMGQGAGQASTPAVAIVNGEPITIEQLDKLVAVTMTLSALESGQPVTITSQQWQQARSELLDQAIRNTLTLQAARSAGITISQDMVDAEWLGLARKYETSPDQVEAQLAQAGATRAIMQEWLGNALVVNLYLRQYMPPGATAEELRQSYQQWIEQQLPAAQIQIYEMPVN